MKVRISDASGHQLRKREEKRRKQKRETETPLAKGNNEGRIHTQ